MTRINNATAVSTASKVAKAWGRRAALGLTMVLGTLCLSPNLVQASDDDQVRQGLPGRRISGASRLPTSACARNANPLVALVPETNLGTTAEAEPTLWLSVPEVTATKQLEFYLFNSQDEIIYQTSMMVDSKTDLAGLDLSTMVDAPRLEVDQRYRWAASIVCNPNNRSENISVEGWVDRVERPDAIAEDASLENSHLWYDRLGTLLNKLQHYPQNEDLLNQWHALMASARLEQIVPLPVDAGAVNVTLPMGADGFH